ncbi:translation initiation factor 4E [Cordyceps fumosorosea ARSEF 2679]|uniref:Translation initiation factor 4E n=1 Tax=Cordyceps fumosorosea (strain ARSEF 2679) TaxID=1081104 RepID=A0A167YBG5_CORFA|nr:translation initiation factor 4E [Cordyceps fumosorosea ARSEF 2679]OAA66115.1 translation initiation factor 4E [Cordyceps fumosorosea ARSEF 2679]
MAARPQLFTRNLSGVSPNPETNSPAEQRDDAKRNFMKAMRPLPTQHYWNVYFDRGQETNRVKQSRSQSSDSKPANGEYTAQIEKLDIQIESVQDFWRYSNNTPVAQIKMRESIYLFKSGFRPVWEDRRNITGGSYTFRVPRAQGPDVWRSVQLLAIGEKLQEVLADDDQICGVGLSVRFKWHLITVWNRDGSNQRSIDGIFNCVFNELPEELQARSDNYFYKKHADHEGFKCPPELQGVVDAHRRKSMAASNPTPSPDVAPSADAPTVSIQSPQ